MLSTVLFGIGLIALTRAQDYTHTAWLDQNSRMLLNWRFDDSTQLIAFEVVGRTTGWMAIGFSSNGAMTGADIIIMWMDKHGKPNLIDAHAITNGRPLRDEQQNVELDTMNSNGTHVTARFTRLMNTCDKEGDWKITEDTVRLLWAFNDNEPTDFNSIAMHESENRGSRSMHLLFDQLPVDFEQAMNKVPNVQYSDLVMDNGPVPSTYHTLYWCKVFSLPSQSLKHLVGYDVVLDPPTNRKFVHHFVLYRCPSKLASQAGKSAPCYAGQKGAPPGIDVPDNAAENPMAMCETVLAAWAYGSDGFIFPDDTGLPLFADEGESVYMLEMHYDNHDYVPNIMDNSGVRLYYTDVLRPTQTAHLILGQSGSPNSLIVPPNERSFVASGYCPSECTLDLDPQGMEIYAGFLHTHLIGTAARIRHIRNGVELKPVLQDDHYDFNYQSMVAFKPVTILPGDELMMECIYDSESRPNRSTFGGPSTSDEMCFGFMYAKHLETNNTGGAACLSTPDLKPFLKELGIIDVQPIHHYKSNVVVSNALGENTTLDLVEYMNSGAINWHNKLNNKPIDQILEKSLRDEPSFVYCDLNAHKGLHYFRSAGPPQITVPYIEPDSCNPVRRQSENEAVATSLSKFLVTLILIKFAI